jgi:hypothetical protein
MGNGKGRNAGTRERGNAGTRERRKRQVARGARGAHGGAGVGGGDRVVLLGEHGGGLGVAGGDRALGAARAWLVRPQAAGAGCGGLRSLVGRAGKLGRVPPMEAGRAGAPLVGPPQRGAYVPSCPGLRRDAHRALWDVGRALVRPEHAEALPHLRRLGVLPLICEHTRGRHRLPACRVCGARDSRFTKW